MRYGALRERYLQNQVDLHIRFLPRFEGFTGEPCYYCAVFHQATEHDVDFIDDRVGAFEGGRGSLDENVVLGDDGR